MVYQVEKMLKENGDKISGDEKGQVESAVADAKKALEGTDAAAMNAAREKLTAASHKLAEAMYKAQQRRRQRVRAQARRQALTKRRRPAGEER